MLPPSKLVRTVQIDEITDKEWCCVTNNKILPSAPLLVIVNISKKSIVYKTSYYRQFEHHIIICIITIKYSEKDIVWLVFNLILKQSVFDI